LNFIVSYHALVGERDFPRIGAPARKRIIAAIESKLMTDPIVFGKPLRSALAHFRTLRVGDYRIVYAVSTKDVFILAVGHRRDIYQIANERG
jgi:mRNA-degrading endonuclease RelE of RelBE toxin-antitoxin system